MINYKWCVCDMDGTLLNSNDSISVEDEAAIKKLKQSGVEVIIASGRLDLLVKRFMHQLDLHGYVISCNGGLIRNIHTGEIIHSNAMDKSMVKELLLYCFERRIDFLVYTPYVMFSNRDNSRAARYESINQLLIASLRFEVRYLENADMSALEGLDILKVLLIFPTQEQVDAHVNKYSVYDNLYAVSSAPGLVDIMAAGTSKGQAVKILAGLCGVKLSEVIAFGDNYNDIEMLQSVGMPIAMENSVEDLKAVARYVTRSNDESGIAYAINNLI